jgi:hypothetical protein
MYAPPNVNCCNFRRSWLLFNQPVRVVPSPSWGGCKIALQRIEWCRKDYSLSASILVWCKFWELLIQILFNLPWKTLITSTASHACPTLKIYTQNWDLIVTYLFLYKVNYLLGRRREFSVILASQETLGMAATRHRHREVNKDRHELNRPRRNFNNTILCSALLDFLLCTGTSGRT